MSNQEAENSSADYQRYIDHRNRLIDLSVDQINRFDRLAISLSGGALAISMTFIDKIAPTIMKGSGQYLMVSWVLFIVSILSTLSSHQTSQRDMIVEIDALDRNFESGKEDANRINWWKKSTQALNVLSALAFSLGAGALAVFAYLNLS